MIDGLTKHIKWNNYIKKHNRSISISIFIIIDVFIPFFTNQAFFCRDAASILGPNGFTLKRFRRRSRLVAVMDDFHGILRMDFDDWMGFS